MRGAGPGLDTPLSCCSLTPSLKQGAGSESEGLLGLGLAKENALCRSDSSLSRQLHFDPEACSFRELLLEDGYNVYQSEAHSLPLRLPQRDAPNQDPASWGPVRFLPVPGGLQEPQEPPGFLAPEPPDVGSSDPLSMVEPLAGRSPSYAS